MKLSDEEKGEILFYNDDMKDSRIPENEHPANPLVLGKDHCGFCYNAVMDFRAQLAESLEDYVHDVVLSAVEHIKHDLCPNDQVYRAKHKILKAVRGD